MRIPLRTILLAMNRPMAILAIELLFSLDMLSVMTNVAMGRPAAMRVAVIYPQNAAKGTRSVGMECICMTAAVLDHAKAAGVPLEYTVFDNERDAVGTVKAVETIIASKFDLARASEDVSGRRRLETGLSSPPKAAKDAGGASAGLRPAATDKHEAR